MRQLYASSLQYQKWLYILFQIDLNNDSSIQALSMLEFLHRFFKPKSRMKQQDDWNFSSYA